MFGLFKYMTTETPLVKLITTELTDQAMFKRSDENMTRYLGICHK